MSDTERASSDMMQRLQSSFGASSCSIMKQQQISLASSKQLDVNHLSNTTVRHFTQTFGVDSGKRVGVQPSHPSQIPPILPFSQVSVSRPPVQPLSFQNFVQVSSLSRTVSQPGSGSFNLDSLPPLSPSPYREAPLMSGSNSCYTGGDYGFHAGEGLPPRKTHRRSKSDGSFGFSMMQSSLQPLAGWTPASGKENVGGGQAEMVKGKSPCNGDGSGKNAEGMEERKSEGEVIDEMFSTYMNLDKAEAMTSSGTNYKHGDGRLVSGSDNETEGSINESGDVITKQGADEVMMKREKIQRCAPRDIAPTTSHHRRVSMDCFMGNMNFGEDSFKLPSSPCPRPGKLSPSASWDKNSNSFSLEFGSGEFSGDEMKKIMANEKLAEMALVDPKRVKRVLANRLSAARSKERKTRYISELEHKVHALQAEATTLSAQVTLLQRDSAALTSQNSELRFRLQAMEQQAHLRDALNETLSGEVQRLKRTFQQLGLGSHSSKGMSNSYTFQMLEPKQQENNSPIPEEESSA